MLLPWKLLFCLKFCLKFCNSNCWCYQNEEQCINIVETFEMLVYSNILVFISSHQVSLLLNIMWPPSFHVLNYSALIFQATENIKILIWHKIFLHNNRVYRTINLQTNLNKQYSRRVSKPACFIPGLIIFSELDKKSLKVF